MQAGGSWGYWPYQLAKIFDTVYTFEPDPVSFDCLAENCKNVSNIIKFQACLGPEMPPVGLRTEKEDNRGTTRVFGPGQYPVLTIDSFMLQWCDLLYLDVEGSEENALMGASQTITKYKPVIAFESTHKYDEYGSVERRMAWHNYVKVGRSGRDIFMVHKADVEECLRSLQHSGLIPGE